MLNAGLLICLSHSFGPDKDGDIDLQWMNLVSRPAQDSVSNKGGINAAKCGYDVPVYKIVSKNI